MTYFLTLFAATIIAIVVLPFYLVGTLLSKIGLLIMMLVKALAEFGMKLIDEQREREAKRDDILS